LFFGLSLAAKLIVISINFRLIFDTMKVEVFNIEDKKTAQREAEMQMKPIDRLYLCLDLMDLSRVVSKDKEVKAPSDGIEWIELSLSNAK
jgi:hypothetical protein